MHTILTNHIEIELSNSSQRAPADNWNQRKINWQWKHLSQQESWDKHTERRLTTLYDVCERHRHFGHAHRRSHMPNRVRHRHLLTQPKPETNQKPKSPSNPLNNQTILTGKSAFKKSESIWGGSTTRVAQEMNMMRDPAATESNEVNHG